MAPATWSVTARPGQPSTAHEHLTMFYDVAEAKEFSELMKQASGARKMRGTYVDGYMKHLFPGNLFHPTCMLFKGDMFDGGAEDDEDSGTACVTADTLFLTSRGYLPFHSMRSGDSVLGHFGLPRTVTDLVKNGVKPVVRVTLSNGLFLDCTRNHPFLTSVGWVRADALKTDTLVRVYGTSEEWRPVEEWPFEVSSWGRVKSSATGHVIAQQPKGKWGHLKVCLVRNNARSRGPDRIDFPVHRLVASAFIPFLEAKPEVRHRNGIAWDNCAWNLAWGTRQENASDTARHGNGRGKHGNQQRLNWTAVKLIRTSVGAKDRDLAKIFGVSRELVRDVRLGKKWTNYVSQVETKFSLASITSVVELGDLQTFGVTVADDHSHVTNGIVTHNTGRTAFTGPAYY